MTYSDAIAEAKAKAKAAGWKYQSEDSQWTTISNGPGSGTGYVPTMRQEYKIYYDQNRIITITREEIKNPSTGISSYKFTSDAPNSSASTGGTVVAKGIRTSGDSSKVLYFTNYARLFLNVKDNDEYIAMSVAYLIIYIALVTFTVVFTFRYIKRVIYIAFLTMIAPMVALTYPLDKLKDRKSTGLEYVV